MAKRLALLLFISTNLFAQCDEVATPIQAARRSAVAVFQGTVESFRGEDPDRRVIFRVSRVWKGPVGRSFEMPALETTGASCYGFLKGLLVPGSELIVFAYY